VIESMAMASRDCHRYRRNPELMKTGSRILVSRVTPVSSPPPWNDCSATRTCVIRLQRAAITLLQRFEFEGFFKNLIAIYHSFDSEARGPNDA